LQFFWILLLLVHARCILYTASLGNALASRFFENRALPYAIEIDEWRDKDISIEGAVIPA
jgi:hypothetical protein